MEALAIFGVACNVIQVLSFSHEVLSSCKHVYRDGSLDPDLEYKSTQLRALANELDISLSSNARATKNATSNSAARTTTQTQNIAGKAQSRLQDVATKLLKATSDLVIMTGKVKVDGPASRHKALVKTASYYYKYRQKLKALQSTMESLESTMNTEILVKLHLTQEAQTLLAREEFSSLSQALQRFMERYAEGNTRVSTLASREAKLIKEHVRAESTTTREQSRQEFALNSELITAESSTTRDHMTRVFQDLNINMVTKDQQRILLESLMYPESNARRSHIAESHKNTFRWIFDHEHKGPWDNFPDWVRSNGHNIYWMSGKAGSGKSCLTKFLVEGKETKKMLLQQNPNTRILSFFFWNSGTNLQRSLVGMLSSLLHQILRENITQLGALLSEDPLLSYKHQVSDWSIRELEQTIIKVFAERICGYCIFIDGLDEIDHRDGQFELLEILNTLRLQPNIKLCVSSRPEPVLLKSLKVYPRLRLQDLTTEDIRRYAADILDPLDIIMETRDKDKNKEKLIRKVVSKAEGVFLWAHLVSRSLQTGITNEDDWKTLIKRLDRLPGDMNQLYSQMWLRLNEDQDLYRAEAANYFRLMLDRTETRVQQHKSVLEIAIASERSLEDGVYVTDEGDGELIQLCTTVENRIVSRCAGLLEVIDPPVRPGQTAFRGISVESLHFYELSRITERRVSFIHRSARDFLLDPNSGSAILRNCTKSDEELCSDLIRGHFISTICTVSSGFQLEAFDSTTFLPNLYNFGLMMFFLMQRKKYLSQHKTFELLNWYWMIHKQDLHKIESCLFFLMYVAQYGYYTYVREHVERMGKENGSMSVEILSQLLLGTSYSFFRPRGIEFKEQEKAQLIKWLLKIGADPHLAVTSTVYGECDTPFAVGLKECFFSALDDSFLLGEAIEQCDMKAQTSTRRRGPCLLYEALQTTTIMYQVYPTAKVSWGPRSTIVEFASKEQKDPFWQVVFQVNLSWLVKEIEARRQQMKENDIISVLSKYDVPAEISVAQVFFGREHLSEAALNGTSEEIMNVLIQNTREFSTESTFLRYEEKYEERLRIQSLLQSVWEAAPEKSRKIYKTGLLEKESCPIGGIYIIHPTGFEIAEIVIEPPFFWFFTI